MRIIVVSLVLALGLLVSLTPINFFNSAKASANDTPWIETVTELETGQAIYDRSGQKVGTIMALTTRGGEVLKVWSYSTAFEKDEIIVENGRVTLTAPIELTAFEAAVPQLRAN